MRTIRLIDVCEFVRNGANIKQLANETRGIPITRIETLSNDEFNRDRLGYANINDDSYSDYYLQEGDVLLSHINGAKFIGRSVMYQRINNETIIHGMNLLCIRFKNCYNPKFFCYYAKSRAAKNYFEKHTKKAVNQASITSTDIKNMPIPDIALDEQNKIVGVLDLIYERCKFLSQDILLCDEAIEARFTEMFGDLFYNDNNYQVVKIKDFIEYEQPTKYIVSSENYSNDFKTPVLTAGKNFILGYTNENSGIFNATEQNVVIFDDFTCDNKFVDFDFKVKSSAMKILKAKKGINISFFYYALRQNHYVVANHKRHWISVFENMEFGLPPIEQQNTFASFSKLINSSKNAVKKEAVLAEELKAKKMFDYFFKYEED